MQGGRWVMVLGLALGAAIGGLCPTFAFAAPADGAVVPTAHAVVRIDSLLAAGRADAAAAAALRLLADPGLPPRLRPPLLQRRCVALQAAGRLDEARPACEEAVLAAPEDPVNHRNFATCLQGLGQFGRAVGELQQALEQAPGQVEWRLQYAQVLGDLGAPGEAARQIEVAARDCPACPLVDRALADQALRTAQPQRAIAPLQRLYAASGEPALRERLVQACWEAGRFGALDSTLTAATADSLSSRELRLWLQADRERLLTERARRLATGAETPVVTAAARREPATWALAAEICLAAGDLVTALAAIDRASTLAPDDGRWHRNRAAILARMGRGGDAAAALRRARDLGQDGP